jgi:hypothetical protein
VVVVRVALVRVAARVGAAGRLHRRAARLAARRGELDHGGAARRLRALDECAEGLGVRERPDWRGRATEAQAHESDEWQGHVHAWSRT